MPVVLTAIAFWPRGEQSTSVSAESGTAPTVTTATKVRVSGRVGQVFPVGGGYAFYLFERGDTLVVFTRSRACRSSAST